MTVFSAVITVAVSAIASYASKHYGIVNDATRNQAIADAATRLAPIVINKLDAIGVDIAKVSERKTMEKIAALPEIQEETRRLLTSYPQFTRALKMSQDDAAHFVLSAAMKMKKLTSVNTVKKEAANVKS